MLRKQLLSVALLVFCLASIGTTFCPATGYRGNIYSAQIIASLDGGSISILDGEDTQCYNYSLPYAFTDIPDVAIAVHSFQAQPTNNLFFYIKPVRSESLSYLPFLVRTQWPYTQWNQISFNFIAEDRNDLQAGYYQVDSGPLAGCENGKAIDVLLPFRSQYNHGRPIQHTVFLHGFEISTVKTEGNTRSPFQLQIVSTTANVSGIAVSLSVTTSTRVDSIYLSFVAFQDLTIPIVGGRYIFDSAVDSSDKGFFFVPETDVPPNFARLYGLTGFLINFKNQRLNYATNWNSISFIYNLGDAALLKYFSFSFIFFSGSECQDCPGYQIYDNGACVSSCPLGTYLTADNTCINCGTGKEWNGTICITSCVAGQYLNTTSGLCECPPTLNWDGQSCIPCLQGKVWSAPTKSCQCPKPLMWNGFACAKIDPCVGGKIWDVYSYTCQCPDGTFWNGEQCISLALCTGGQIRDVNNTCVCPQGFVWSSNFCIYSPCTGGQIWTGSKCVCPAGLNYNGSMCLQCINGQKWDSKKSACACESGYEWNGQYCQKSYKCSNGRVWNPVYQQCICAEGSYWSGYACLVVQKCSGGQYFDSTIQKCVCLSGFQWDGKRCIQCKNAKVWNVTTLSCTCPPGTIPFGNGPNSGCKLQQSCTGGKEWNQNSWTCECPDKSIWNGVFCILNPCAPGQKWNETVKKCVCPEGKMFLNQTCVPLQIACTNGRVWNEFIYACACPSNTFPTPTSCDPMPTCPKGKIYNPLNNKCQCPFGLAQNGDSCTDPRCPVGQFYNGDVCQVINCPPPSYFSRDRCVYGGDSNECNFGYRWNGRQCIFYPNSCPSGTNWSGLTCQSTNGCGQGYYSGPNGCAALPQQCPPPSAWDGSKCSTSGSLCPKGTYSQGGKCYPYQSCRDGFVWDTTYLRCVCPPGTINNGNKCVQCSNDQRWLPSVGCACPDGSFDTGASCQYVNPNKCSIILNSVWDNNKCVCRPGFTKVGFQCLCFGTQNGNLCDKCSYKPNSRLNPLTDTCECIAEYTQIKGMCIKTGSQQFNNDRKDCAVGTYFDTNHKACLSCPDGCLTCQDCYRCQVCRPEFTYQPKSQKCFEFCGDGKRFNVECDDGNNEDGDGCSRDCKIEPQYTCSGGSPESRDSCTAQRLEQVTIEQFGQIRKSTSVVINFKLNYLPNSLIKSNECQNKCSQILTGSIVSGETALSITSEYLSGTRYIFTMTIEFGRSYMARFRLRVGINSAVSKYFGGASIAPVEITVQPSFLMSVSEDEGLL